MDKALERKTRELQRLEEEQREIRQMLGVITDGKSQGMISTFRSFLENEKAQYVNRYDYADPEDAKEVARCQEGRALISKISNFFTRDHVQNLLANVEGRVKTVKNDIERIQRSEATTGLGVVKQAMEKRHGTG